MMYKQLVLTFDFTFLLFAQLVACGDDRAEVSAVFEKKSGLFSVCPIPLLR
jgi:hypothetical protein